MGLSSSDFYDLTPIEFDYALKEHIEFEHSKQKFESNWIRLQTYYLLNIQLDKESRFSSPEAFMPFDWDEKREPDKVLVITEDDFINFDKKYIKGHLN